MMFLAGRKKYEKTLSGRCDCFNRKLFTGKNDILNILKKYEVKKGLYVDTVVTLDIPQHALALYCSVNSRNVDTAIKEMTKFIINKKFEKNELTVKDAKIENYLHKYANKEYVGIDLDSKDEKVFASIKKDLLEKIPKIIIIETRGGYHILFEQKYLKNKVGTYIYTKFLEKYDEIDKIKSDLFSPIPGTLQGGFKVRFVDP
jgi:hypothetical protein